MTITTSTPVSQSYSSPETTAGPVALKPMPKTSTQPAAGQMGIPGVRAPGTPMSKDALDVWEFALFPKLSNALGQGFKNGVNPEREALARDLRQQGTGAEPFPAERKDAAQNWTPAERRELTVRVTDALVKWERQKADLTTKHQTGDLPDRNTVLRTAFKTAYDDISERRTGSSTTRAKPEQDPAQRNADPAQPDLPTAPEIATPVLPPISAPRVETPEEAGKQIADALQRGRDIAKQIIDGHRADPLGGSGLDGKLTKAADDAISRGNIAEAMGIMESIPAALPKRNAAMPQSPAAAPRPQREHVDEVKRLLGGTNTPALVGQVLKKKFDLSDSEVKATLGQAIKELNANAREVRRLADKVVNNTPVDRESVRALLGLLEQGAPLWGPAAASVVHAFFKGNARAPKQWLEDFVMRLYPDLPDERKLEIMEVMVSEALTSKGFNPYDILSPAESNISRPNLDTARALARASNAALPGDKPVSAQVPIAVIDDFIRTGTPIIEPKLQPEARQADGTVHPRQLRDNESLPKYKSSHGTSVLAVAIGNTHVLKAIFVNDSVPPGQNRDEPEAIKMAIQQGARVVTLCMGFEEKTEGRVLDIVNSNPGVLFIFAYGNAGGTNNRAFAGLQNTLLVGGADEVGNIDKTLFQYPEGPGAGIDVLARSTNVQTTKVIKDLEDYQDIEDGSSLGAPLVTNSSGVMLALAPGLDATQVRKIIKASAEYTENLATNDVQADGVHRHKTAVNVAAVIGLIDRGLTAEGAADQMKLREPLRQRVLQIVRDLNR